MMRESRYWVEVAELLSSAEQHYQEAQEKIGRKARKTPRKR
jgi:hypothetical protein